MISSIKTRFARRLDRQHLILGALCVFIAIQLPYKLAQFPPFWWDEGHVANVAHNWIQLGHYGRFLAGKPVPLSLDRHSIGFPAVAPVALSFRLLGVGVRQARLPGVLFTVGALAALWLLARRLYDQSVATVALTAAVLLPVLPDMHPVLVGRQALGEMPALFYLLMGLLCLQQAWGRPGRFLPLGVVFWSLSLQTKPEVIPFLTAALLLPLILLLWKRRLREARILGLGLVGALMTGFALARLWALVLGGCLSSPRPVGNMFAAIDASHAAIYVFQLDPRVRLTALFVVVLSATPAVLGMCYVGWGLARSLADIDGADERLLGRCVLWTLAASWFAWFVLLSIAWPRYLFPAAFLGNVFAAVLLRDLTHGFSVTPWKRWSAALRERGPVGGRVGTVATLLVLPVAFLLTMYYSYAGAILVGTGSDLQETAHFLNVHTEPEALIEMDDRELFFLVERGYHYPDLEVHHQLNRRVFLREDVTLDYDPLVADPDYLVVGPMSRMWELYDPILETEAFGLIHANGRYQIYERVRDHGGRKEPQG